MGLYDDMEPQGSQASSGLFDDLEPEKSGIARRVLGDTGVSAMKGLAAVPEMLVGLADIPTGGRAGKLVEDNMLVDFKGVQDYWGDMYSPEQKAANAKVQGAEGFGETLGQIADNPSVIPHAVVESLPSMLAGGVIGKGLKAAPVIGQKISSLAAGAIGEGSVMAGSAAEGMRQQTEDGLLTPKQQLAAAGTGVLGAAVGVGGAKVAQRLGLGDVDTAMVDGALGTSSRSLPARIAGSAAIEGGEELLQSSGEVVSENLALDRGLTEGLGNAAAMGLVTGGAMGAGFGALSGRRADQVQPTPSAENPTPAPVPRPDPNAGALSRAAALLPAPSIAGRLPAPDTLYADSQGNVNSAGPVRNVDGTLQPDSQASPPWVNPGNAPSTGGAGMDQQTERGAQPGREGDYIPASRFAGQQVRAGETIDGQLAPEATGLPAPQQRLADGRPDAGFIETNAAGESRQAKASNVPPKDYVPQGGRGMDQQTPIGKKYTNVLAAKNAIQKAGVAATHEAVQVAPRQFEVRAKQVPKKRIVNRDRDSLTQAITRLGGIKTNYRQDTTGDTKGNKFLPGVGALWSDRTGTSLDDMASLLDQNGYVPAGEMNRDGGVSWLQSALGDELAGRRTTYAPGAARQEAELLKQEAERNAAQLESLPGDVLEAKLDAVFDLTEEVKALEARRLEHEQRVAELDKLFGDTDASEEQAAGSRQPDRNADEVQGSADQGSGLAGSRDTDQGSRTDAPRDTPAEALELTQQTETELADLDRQQKERDKAAAEVTRKADEQARKAADAAFAKQQNEAANAEFTLGGDAEQNLTGQRGMFDAPAAADVKAAADEAATSPSNDLPEPTAAQKEAGNYRKGHVSVQGLNLSIENPKGSVRRGTDPDGNEWSHAMSDHYGYIKRTEGADGDHVDIYLGDNPASEQVFVVDQVSKDGVFDEHKVMLGFDSQPQAVAAYKKNFDDGWRVGPVTAMPMQQFKGWLKDGDTRSPLAVPAASQAKPAAKTASKKPAEKIEDAGEQLTYNRKNMFRSGGLKWDDIATENEALKIKLAGKEKIWARPNWEQIIEAQPEGQRDGFRMVAHLVKQAYDGLPKQSTSKTDEGLQRYIAAVTELRDAAETLLGDRAQVEAVITAVAVKAQRRMSRSFSIADATANDVRGDDMPLFKALFPAQAAGARFERGTPANDKGAAIGNKAIKAMQWNADSAVDAMKAIEAGWPAKQEAWQKRGYAVFHNAAGEVKARHYESKNAEEPQAWASLQLAGRNIEQVAGEFTTKESAETAANARIKALDGQYLVLDKRKQLLGSFADEEAAIDFARSQTARKQDDSAVEDDADQDWDARTGEQRRPGGQNISADDLKEAFGFRGVSFGNWVKQGERQQHLNAAYDAFADLADVMGLPPKAMSLNGMLGVAFGAQGSGKFAAHFIPGVNEINITKTRGAGSLAHEWAHGLDHYFGVQAGLGREENPFASVLGQHRRDKAEREIRPEIAQAFKDLVLLMRTRNEDPADVVRRRQEALTNAKVRVGAEADRLRPRVAGNTEALAALDAAVAGDVGEYVDLPIPKGKRKPIGAIPKNIKTVFDALGYSSQEANDQAHRLQSVFFASEELKREVTTRAVHSQFYKNSAALEGKSSKPYWATQWEMFARAFESWVMDALAEKGRANNYLVRSSKKDQGDGSTAPYPAGAERELINQAFAKLAADIKHRQPDDAGNVALYRLSDTQAKGIPLFSARAIANKISKTTGLKVETVASEAGLPDAVQAQIKRDGVSGRVAGVYHNGTSYLIASNLRDTKHAMSIVLHEAVGHGGVKAVLGARLDKVMQEIYSDMPAAIKRDLEQRYAGQTASLGTAEAQTLIAEEYVAHLAESDPQNGIIARLVAMLRQFIRDTFGDAAALKWSRGDLVQLLAEARQSAASTGSDSANRYSAAEEVPLPEVAEASEAEFVASLAGANGAFAKALYKARGTDSPFFKGWFGKSRMVDKQGRPVAFVHRSYGERNTFNDASLGGNSGTPTAALGHFLARKDVGNVERYGPVTEQFYIRMNKPKVVTQDQFEAMGDWSLLKVKAYRKTLMEQGHDGLYIQGLAWPVVFEGKNIKAARNAGTFDESSDVRYSLADDAATADALRKLGLGSKDADGVIEQIRSMTLGGLKAKLAGWATRSREGLFDGLDGILRAEKSLDINDPNQQGYVSARMATGIADVMHGVLHYAAPVWRDGVIAGKADTRGVLEVLGDLGQDNLTPWLAWLGGKRAQMLKAQGRENNLTDADIAELLAMGKGKEALFDKVYQDYAKINEAVLDLAQEAGLIDQDARAKWATEYYVPFYRVDESEGLFSGPRSKKGLSHQTAAIKALKGGTLPTNDLLTNMLAGWTKRIDASLKNKALTEVVDNLQGSEFLTDESPRYQQVLISRSQIAEQIRKDRKALAMAAEMLGLPAESKFLKVANQLMKPENEGFEQLWTRVAPTDPDIIRLQRGGKSEYYRVNDESLLRGLKFMEGSVFNDPITRIGRTFKRLLTTGVTASPDFILRNFIRDAAHAWMINKDGFALGKDSIRGMRDALREDQDYRDLMFAGGSFQGGYVHGTDPEASAQIIRRALEKKGFTREQQSAYMGSLVNTPAKAAGMLKQGWQSYRTLGDKVENANRLATYKRALAAGKSKRQAAFEAKDLMDYSMRGNFAAAQWFTDVVPFLNARMQGLYKLGRAVKGDKTLLAKEVAMKGGYIALFSLLLAGLNDDDERYQELMDWDKDMHWHIFLGDQHFRIPKPFELGLLFGTVPERLLHALTGTQDGGDLAKAVSQGVFQTLAFNPVPQFYQPIRELQANRNFFRDMPIEDMSDEGKLPEARFDERTSAIGRSLGQITGPVLGISPKQIDHLVQGYTGTIGGYVLGMSSLIADGLRDGESPAWRTADMPVAKVLYQGDAVRSTKYQGEFYDMMREADQLHRTIKSYREEGQVEAAEKLFDESRDKLRNRPGLGLARKQLGNIRKQRDAIYRNTTMDGDTKRQRLDDLQRRANQIAERIARRAGEDF